MSVVVCANCYLLCHCLLELVSSLFLLFSHLTQLFSHLCQLFPQFSELVVAVSVVAATVVVVVVVGSLGCWLLFLFLLCVCRLLSWHVDLENGVVGAVVAVERLSLVVVELTTVEVVDAHTGSCLVDDCSQHAQWLSFFVHGPLHVDIVVFVYVCTCCFCHDGLAIVCWCFHPCPEP